MFTRVACSGRWAITLVLLALVAGCGNPIGTYKVTGKVKFKDGAPLPKGTVIFDSGKHSAQGEIQSDGSYTLGSFGKGDGAPAGKYQVSIGGAAAGGGDPYKPDPPLVHSRFLSKDTSGLTCEVTNKSVVFDIEVDKP